MDKVLQILSDIRVIIVIAVLVVLLITWLIIQKIRTNKYKKQLQEMEVRYNKIKSVPLSFKLNKAVAISRVDPNAMQKVAKTKDDFDKAEANLKQISQTLADTEDEILMGKLKRAKGDLDDLSENIKLGERQVKALDEFLDSILEKETVQRQEVTELKNRFRDLKEDAQEHSSQLNYSWDAIQTAFTDIEKMFSAFEEWMYASDFAKASEELTNIKNGLDRLDTTIHQLPTLLQDTRGVVPKMAEVLHQDYAENRDRGVYLKHLEVEKNLKAITGNLKKDLESLKACDPTGVAEHLEDYKKRIAQMDEAVKKESESFDQLVAMQTETNQVYTEAQDTVAYLKTQIDRSGSRLGIESLTAGIDEAAKELEAVESTKPELDEMVSSGKYPASELLMKFQKINDQLTLTNSRLTEVRTRIDSASGDEDRAKKQLVKLQVIVNQMAVSIRKYKLPSISAQYEEDMNKAGNYIFSLEKLINESPINVDLLNATLKEAIDYIYTLHNNVNNVVGAVVMVEKTIVFGNRYRSTYADIDSELTRAELAFHNGQYTEALNIAIDTIEKIYPVNYKKMVEENAKDGE